MRGTLSKFLLGTAFLTCPCHLPIYLALLSGTVLGAYLWEHIGFSIFFITAYFFLSLGTGLWLWGRAAQGKKMDKTEMQEKALRWMA